MRKFVLLVIFAAFTLSAGVVYAGDMEIKPFGKIFAHYAVQHVQLQ